MISFTYKYDNLVDLVNKHIYLSLFFHSSGVHTSDSEIFRTITSLVTSPSTRQRQPRWCLKWLLKFSQFFAENWALDEFVPWQDCTQHFL